MTTKSYFEKLERQYGVLTFGQLMRAWRLAEGMNQTIFAKKIGLSVQNLNDLEKSRRIPTPARASRIAKKLKVPEIGLIQLALRDALLKEGFHYDVKLESA
jgi:transcriptional regulator with XRE-family HTH domain